MRTGGRGKREMGGKGVWTEILGKRKQIEKMGRRETGMEGRRDIEYRRQEGMEGQTEKEEM